MYLTILLLEASQQKPENEENRGNALFFTLVWWSNVNIPKQVLPSVESYSHFKGTSSEIQKFECNLKKPTSDINTKHKFHSTQCMCSHIKWT